MVLCYAVLSCFSQVQLFATPWTVARQAPLSMGILQARMLEWVATHSSRGSSQPQDWTLISRGSCIAGIFFTAEPAGTPLHNDTRSLSRWHWEDKASRWGLGRPWTMQTGCRGCDSAVTWAGFPPTPRSVWLCLCAWQSDSHAGVCVNRRGKNREAEAVTWSHWPGSGLDHGAICAPGRVSCTDFWDTQSGGVRRAGGRNQQGQPQLRINHMLHPQRPGAHSYHWTSQQDIR